MTKWDQMNEWNNEERNDDIFGHLIKLSKKSIKQGNTLINWITLHYTVGFAACVTNWSY